MRLPTSLTSKWLPSVLLSGLAASASFAQIEGATTRQQEAEGETEVILGLSNEWLDNANVNSTTEVEEYETSVDLSVTHSYASNWTDFSTNFLLNYVDFQNDTFEDHAEFTGGAELNLFLVPERLSWITNYTRERSLSSVLLAQTDETELTRGVLQTGPTLTFRMGDTYTLINASYVQVETEEADTAEAGGDDIDDNVLDAIPAETDGGTKRYNYSIRLQRSISPLTMIQIGGTYSDTYEVSGPEAIDDDTGRPIDRSFISTNYQIGFTRTLKQGEASFSWGANSVERATGLTTDGTFFAANVSLESLGGTFVLAATKALTDSSLGLSISTGFTGRLENGDTNFGSSDVVKRERIEAQFERPFLNGNGTVNMGISYDLEDYTTSRLDTKRNGAELGFEYSMSQHWDMGAEVTYQETEFVDQAQFGTDKTYVYNLDTSYDFTSNFQGSLRFSYASRSNDDELLEGEFAVDDRDYDQTSIMLSVQYTLF